MSYWEEREKARRNATEEIIAIEPAFFRKGFYLEVDAGWVQIVKTLVKYARSRKKAYERMVLNDNYPDVTENPFDDFFIEQVKQKFAGLRFYYMGGDDDFKGAVEYAEFLASDTCEVCGKNPAKEHGRGWIKTLCEDCVLKKVFEFPD